MDISSGLLLYTLTAYSSRLTNSVSDPHFLHTKVHRRNSVTFSRNAKVIPTADMICLRMICIWNIIFRCFDISLIDMFCVLNVSIIGWIWYDDILLTSLGIITTDPMRIWDQNSLITVREAFTRRALTCTVKDLQIILSRLKIFATSRFARRHWIVFLFESDLLGYWTQ